MNSEYLQQQQQQYPSPGSLKKTKRNKLTSRSVRMCSKLLIETKKKKHEATVCCEANRCCNQHNNATKYYYYYTRINSLCAVAVGGSRWNGESMRAGLMSESSLLRRMRYQIDVREKAHTIYFSHSTSTILSNHISL